MATKHLLYPGESTPAIVRNAEVQSAVELDATPLSHNAEPGTAGEIADVVIHVPSGKRACRQLEALLVRDFSWQSVEGTSYREYRCQILADHTIAFLDALSRLVRRAFRRRVGLIVDSESFAWGVRDVATWKPTSRRRARVWVVPAARIEEERQTVEPLALPIETDGAIGAIEITVPVADPSQVAGLAAAMQRVALTVSTTSTDDSVDLFAICSAKQFEPLLAATRTVVARDFPGSTIQTTPPLPALAPPRCIQCSKPITAQPITLIATRLVQEDGMPRVTVTCPNHSPTIAITASARKERSV